MLLTVASAQINFFGGELQKGLKALDRGNYEKALEHFENVLKKDSTGVGANFGLAQIYSSKDFKSSDPDKAHKLITLAELNYSQLNKKQNSLLLKYNIDLPRITSVRNKIEEEIFTIAANENSIESYNRFIKKYPGNPNISKAIDLRNQLMASSGSSAESLDVLLKKNPNSPEVVKAVKLRDLLAFQKAKSQNTAEALKKFIVDFPKSEQLSVARDLLAEYELIRVKKVNTVTVYDSFIQNFSESPLVNEAIIQRNELAYINLLEAQKKRDNVALQEKEALVATQSLKINMMIGAAIMMALTIGLVYRSYHQKKVSNREITKQKEITEQKNKEIVDSINYAKRIQSSLLPHRKEISKFFPEAFIFYKPRDIVSGDFYWFARVGNRSYIAAADCTGHGVPGALVSMLGFNFLNQIVNELHITDPGKILDELHVRVTRALNKEKDPDERDMRDGMDIALLAVDEKQKLVEYSGAVRPLYYIDENGLNIVKGNVYSIGGIKSYDTNCFQTHTIKVKSKADFYLFSDGYADQFGGENGKKFKLKNLQSLLLTAQGQSMETQGRIIEKTFYSWAGDHEQVDDVCVVGLRI